MEIFWPLLSPVVMESFLLLSKSLSRISWFMSAMCSLRASHTSNIMGLPIFSSTLSFTMFSRSSILLLSIISVDRFLILINGVVYGYSSGMSITNFNFKKFLSSDSEFALMVISNLKGLSSHSTKSSMNILSKA